jgi:hypothetical protein
MKNITKLFAIAIAIIGFSATSFAQVTGHASTSATILTPIAITKNTDMNFGNVAINNTTGTVILATNSARSFTGGITFPVVTGTVAAAKFTVTGETNATYSISLPASVTLTNGANSMIVDAFTSTPSGTGALAAGTQEILVGATLNVGASQASGTYTNAADLAVTVNYN